MSWTHLHCLVGVVSFVAMTSEGLTAQPESLSRVTIQAPEELAEARVQVNIGQINAPIHLDSTATAQITVSEEDVKSFYLQVSYSTRRSGNLRSVVWRDSINLIPDGVIFVTLEEDVQPGEIGQFETNEWPVVTWSASGGTLDAYLNGRSRGTTDQTRAVRPGRDHRLEWRSGNTIVCSRVLRLDNGQRRKFSCNRATGQLSEQ